MKTYEMTKKWWKKAEIRTCQNLTFRLIKTTHLHDFPLCNTLLKITSLKIH